MTLALDGTAVPIAAPEERRADALRWGEDYELLSELYGEAVGQWSRYMSHVAAVVGSAGVGLSAGIVGSAGYGHALLARLLGLAWTSRDTSRRSGAGGRFT